MPRRPCTRRPQVRKETARSASRQANLYSIGIRQRLQPAVTCSNLTSTADKSNELHCSSDSRGDFDKVGTPNRRALSYVVELELDRLMGPHVRMFPRNMFVCQATFKPTASTR